MLIVSQKTKEASITAHCRIHFDNKNQINSRVFYHKLNKEEAACKCYNISVYL
jgi:hypothetical protein